MDTLNDVMNDLLIDQNGRLEEQGICQSLDFSIKAQKAEKIILRGTDGVSNANKN